MEIVRVSSVSWYFPNSFLVIHSIFLDFLATVNILTSSGFNQKELQNYFPGIFLRTGKSSS